MKELVTYLVVTASLSDHSRDVRLVADLQHGLTGVELIDTLSNQLRLPEKQYIVCAQQLPYETRSQREDYDPFEDSIQLTIGWKTHVIDFDTDKDRWVIN